MPDLDWETEAVRDGMKKASSFWLDDMGADGLRLDAVRHLMEDEEGRSTNVPRTHDMLREYGNYVRTEHPGSYTVGEVFDGHEALLAYYPDQLDSYFAFGISDAILGAVKSGSGEGLLEAVLAMQEAVPNDRYAPFLRNHDQSRTMTVLEGDLQAARMAATLLLTLPGVPFVYYGEELGMAGDKPDPRIRTPMPWTLGKGAGFSAVDPWESLQEDSLTANVEVQHGDAGSILNLYRRLIHLRAAHPVLGARAELIPLRTGTRRAVAYLRRADAEAALVLVNLAAEPLEGVAFSSDPDDAVLPPGTYRLETLLGEAEASPLEVSEAGRIDAYAPVATLAPRRAHVFVIVGAGTR
jgi:glycosidase